MNGYPKTLEQEEYDKLMTLDEDALNRKYNVIDSLEPLSGWNILLLERWKPGVVRFHARRGNEFQMGFAKDEIFKVLQLPL